MHPRLLLLTLHIACAPAVSPTCDHAPASARWWEADLFPWDDRLPEGALPDGPVGDALLVGWTAEAGYEWVCPLRVPKADIQPLFEGTVTRHVGLVDVELTREDGALHAIVRERPLPSDQLGLAADAGPTVVLDDERVAPFPVTFDVTASRIVRGEVPADPRWIEPVAGMQVAWKGGSGTLAETGGDEVVVWPEPRRHGVGQLLKAGSIWIPAWSLLLPAVALSAFGFLWSRRRRRD